MNQKYIFPIYIIYLQEIKNVKIITISAKERITIVL